MTNKCLQDFRLFKYPFKILYPNFLRHPVCGCQDFRMRHNQRKHCKQSLDHLDCYELSDILEREHLAQKRGETILCVMLVLSQVLSQLINTRFSTGSSFYHLMKQFRKYRVSPPAQNKLRGDMGAGEIGASIDNRDSEVE